MEPLHSRKRRLSTPPTPQLLSPLSTNNIHRSSSLQLSSASQFRVKDRRESTNAHVNKQHLEDENDRQQIQNNKRFHARWRSLRVLYASASEYIAQRKLDSLTKVSCASSRVTLAPVAIPTQPTATVKSTFWARDLALECRRSFVDPLVSYPQLETLIRKALRLHSDLQTTSSGHKLGEVFASLRAVFRAFSARCHASNNEKADFRDILNALCVLDRWRDGERRLLMLWFEEFSTFSNRSTNVVAANDVFHVLMCTTEGEEEESAIRSVVDELIAAASGKSVTQAHFEKFIGKHLWLIF